MCRSRDGIAVENQTLAWYSTMKWAHGVWYYEKFPQTHNLCLCGKGKQSCKDLKCNSVFSWQDSFTYHLSLIPDAISRTAFPEAFQNHNFPLLRVYVFFFFFLSTIAPALVYISEHLSALTWVVVICASVSRKQLSAPGARGIPLYWGIKHINYHTVCSK